MKLTHRDTGDTIDVPDSAVDVYRKTGWAPDDEPAEPVPAAEADPPADDSEPKGRKPRT